jgi:polysaccharide pyruvyl transferase WcaK-like protein
MLKDLSKYNKKAKKTLILARDPNSHGLVTDALGVNVYGCC